MILLEHLNQGGPLLCHLRLPTASVGTSASLLLLSSDEEENTGEETTHPPAVETPATDVSDATMSHVTINSAPRKSISSSGPMPKRRTRQNTQLPEWNKELNSCNPLQN